MHTIGRHLIVEFYGCSAELLNNKDIIQVHMVEAARVTGATVIGEVFHKFSPQGVSGTVVIAESHLSVHTWPENGYVAVDIYTCGGLNPHLGLEYLSTAMKARSYRVQEILRGLPEDLEANCSLSPDDVSIITRNVETFVPRLN